MRYPVPNALLLGVLGLLAVGALLPSRADVPATRSADASTVTGFIDDFLAGRDAPLLEHASPQLKTALEQTSLADVRAKTVGANGRPVGGADKVYISASRRVVGPDGKTYEITATMADGQLAGFFVRSVK
ncbi:MAG TPA: hypothetical protein VF595_06950 [Tepidisphaeraceae bacterium]